MRSLTKPSVLVLAAVLLCGCVDVFPTSPTPDYTIRLMPASGGKGVIAVPPECPDWRTTNNGPLENTPWPQFGCANTRNLAAMVERPEELVEGSESGPANGTNVAGSMQRYNEGKAAALIDPNARAPVQSTTMMDPRQQGGGGQGGSSK